MRSAIAILLTSSAIACPSGRICRIVEGQTATADGYLYTDAAHELEARNAAGIRVQLDRQARSLEACRTGRDRVLSDCADRLRELSIPDDPPPVVAWYSLGASAVAVPGAACYLLDGPDWCGPVMVGTLAVGLVWAVLVD